MKTKQIAYLTAYTPQGEMRYQTTNFEEVYLFKLQCKKVNCPFAVRFKNVKVTRAYVVHQNNIIKTVKNFINYFK